MSYRLKECVNCRRVMHVPRHLFYQVDICEDCVESKKDPVDPSGWRDMTEGEVEPGPEL